MWFWWEKNPMYGTAVILGIGLMIAVIAKAAPPQPDCGRVGHHVVVGRNRGCGNAAGGVL